LYLCFGDALPPDDRGKFGVATPSTLKCIREHRLLWTLEGFGTIVTVADAFERRSPPAGENGISTYHEKNPQAAIRSRGFFHHVRFLHEF